VSTSFQKAWQQMQVVLANSNATEAGIQAAKINLLNQEEQARFSLFSSAMTSGEMLARQEAIWSQARQANLITETQLQRLKQKAEIDSAAATLSSVSTGLSALASAFPKVKGFQYALTVANTATGVMKAYADPTLWWPLNIAVAGAIAAAGVAQLAQIASANPGSGGSVSAPSASTTSAAPTSMPQQLMVQGISPGQLYSGDTVRGLAQALLDFQKDGGQVVLQ
jgi:hypothetical protein